MILFINACVRDDSRTLRLAKDFLASYGRDESITAVELQSQGLSPLDGEKLSARKNLFHRVIMIMKCLNTQSFFQELRRS